MGGIGLAGRARLLSGLTVALVLAALGPSAAFEPPSPAAQVASAAGPVSTASYGARCIGAAFDDTAAFQAAIDTRHTVYAPALGGRCHVTRPMVMRAPGQILFGDGRARTRLVIEPGFAGAGVFVAATGEPGPVWRDLGVLFVQPDVDDRTKLTRYPPAFLVRATPRFEIEQVGCYAATVCVDMTGNSGGATISDFQMSAFETGIDIDGSLDTVRIIDPHWWPFGLSPKQQALFLQQSRGRATALEVGRMDDLIVRGGVFFGGLAMHCFAGKTGPMFGTISGTDFDTGSGIAPGRRQSSNIFDRLHIGGRRRSSHSIDRRPAQHLVRAFFRGGTARRSDDRGIGGVLNISGSEIQLNHFDVTALRQTGPQSLLVLNADHFSRMPNRPYVAPTIELRDGRTTAIGNVATDKGVGAGTFIDVGNDNPFNRLMGNSSPGWKIYTPKKPLGIYASD